MLLERSPTGGDRDTRTLRQALALLHDLELDARRTADATYQERMIERLRSQLPDKMRRVLDMHLRETGRRLRRRYPSDSFGNKGERVYKAIRSKTTRDVHAENLYDSILSTPEFPIHSKAYGISLLNRHLATMAIDGASPEILDTYGWISADMNGVKGQVDCTTYQNVTNFLQAVAQFFLDPAGDTRRWIESQKIKIVPLAAGGDEYALFLDSEKPMPEEFFNEAARRYQQEMANSKHLASFLDFQSESVRLEYSMPTEEQRAAFFRMGSAQREQYLADIDLPDAYYATCGMGGATLREGVLRAVRRGAFSLKRGEETFDTGRFEIAKHLIELAEARQAENKAKVKEAIAFSDPKLARFLCRTHESRRLDERLRESETRLAQEKAHILDLERDNTALRALCSEQSAQIEELLLKKHCE